MARVAASGSEVGHVNELDSVTIGGTGGTRTFTTSTTIFRSGARAWRSQQVTGLGDVSGGIYGTMNQTETGVGCVRFSVYIDSHTALTCGLLSISNSTTGQGIVFEATDSDSTGLNTWRVGFRASSSSEASFLGFTDQLQAQDITLDAWHDVYVRFSVSGGTKTATCSVDNGPEFTATASAGITITTVNRVNLGIAPEPSNGRFDGIVYFDDIIVDNANAAIDHGRYIACMRPVGTPVLSQWDSIGAGADQSARLSDNNSATAIGTSGNSFQNIHETTDLQLSGLPAKVTALYGGFRHGGTTGGSEVATDSGHIDFLDGASASIQNGPTVAGSTTEVSANNSNIYAWTPNSQTLAALDALRVRLQNSGAAVRGYMVRDVWVNVEVAMQVDASETVTNADSVSSIKNWLPFTGTPGLVDVISSLTNRFEQVDVMSLSDGVTSIKNWLTLSDTGTETASVTSIKNWLAFTDTAALVDSAAIFVRASVNLNDGATLADTITSLKASLALEDSVIEVLTLDQMTFVSILLTGGTTTRRVIFGMFD